MFRLYSFSESLLVVIVEYNSKNSISYEITSDFFVTELFRNMDEMTRFDLYSNTIKRFLIVCSRVQLSLSL